MVHFAFKKNNSSVSGRINSHVNLICHTQITCVMGFICSMYSYVVLFTNTFLDTVHTTTFKDRNWDFCGCKGIHL